MMTQQAAAPFVKNVCSIILANVISLNRYELLIRQMSVLYTSYTRDKAALMAALPHSFLNKKCDVDRQLYTKQYW